MNLKSKTCISHKGKPLSFYDIEAEAQENADHIKSKYVNNMMPYKCDKCGYWHLSPENRYTKIGKCNCTDRDNYGKTLYSSKDDANKRLNILYEEQRVRLEIYQCPYSDGWHLTKY